MNEKQLLAAGFESEHEFHRLVSEVDLTIPGVLEAFKYWQRHIGTKDALLMLPRVTGA